MAKTKIFIITLIYILNILLLFDIQLFEVDDPNIFCDFSPILTYVDLYSNKKSIIKNNKNKIGIYLWTNLKTGDSYVGRSINLGRRFSYYFNPVYLTKNSNSRICRALLKYELENFKLEILEYITAQENIVAREQFWISELKPSYNLVTVVENSYTYSHTAESKAKMSVFQKSRFSDPEERKKLDELHNQWAKSPENIAQLLEAQKKWLANPENLKKSLPYIKRKQVQVLNVKTNAVSVYSSLTEAAKAMGCARSTLNYWLDKSTAKLPIKGTYTVSLIDKSE